MANEGIALLTELAAEKNDESQLDLANAISNRGRIYAKNNETAHAINDIDDSSAILKSVMDRTKNDRLLPVLNNLQKYKESVRTGRAIEDSPAAGS